MYGRVKGKACMLRPIAEIDLRVRMIRMCWSESKSSETQCQAVRATGHK